jgi:hypothetical protein
MESQVLPAGWLAGWLPACLLITCWLAAERLSRLLLKTGMQLAARAGEEVQPAKSHL